MSPPPGPVSPALASPLPGAEARRAQRAILGSAYRHPQIALAFARIGLPIREAPCGTARTWDTGQIEIDPAWTRTRSHAELAGLIAHEIAHVALAHVARRGSRDPVVWGLAIDMVINGALLRDGWTLPTPRALPPADLPSSHDTAEAIYAWLTRDGEPRAGSGPQGDANDAPEAPEALNGCVPMPDPAGAGAAGSERLGHDLAATIREVERQAGRGAGSAIGALVAPRPPRVTWRDVIRAGMDHAQASRGYDSPSYARASRRGIAISAGDPRAPIWPAWITRPPRIAVAIDASGSVDRAWLASAIGELAGICRSYPGSRIYVVTHTDRVCDARWIDASTPGESLARFGAHSGGTDAGPAYDAIRAAGRFDGLIHFTDGELGDWPTPPARLIVGLLGLGHDASTPPPGSRVMRIAE